VWSHWENTSSPLRFCFDLLIVIGFFFSQKYGCHPFIHLMVQKQKKTNQIKNKKQKMF